jgi:two-component system chemotaxis response regulator CheB
MVTVIRHPRGRVRVPRPAPARPGLRTPTVGLAASTGGPSALATVLAGLSGLRAAVLVVQHLHPDFTRGLADWMARVSALPVEMATAGTLAEPGRAYLAPGGRHLRIGADHRLELTDRPASLHRPSADELFRSIAEHVGSAGVGVLLTGMGEDGARGLLELHRAGGRTLAQDEASSAVFGMPQAARRLGAVTDLLPLEDIAAAIHRAVAGARV